MASRERLAGIHCPGDAAALLFASVLKTPWKERFSLYRERGFSTPGQYCFGRGAQRRKAWGMALSMFSRPAHPSRRESAAGGSSVQRGPTVTPIVKPPMSEKGRKQRLTPGERSLENAGTGKPGLRLAIAAKCFECQDTGDGTPNLIKARVRDCRAEKCALWPHRGWQSATTGKTWTPP